MSVFVKRGLTVSIHHWEKRFVLSFRSLCWRTDANTHIYRLVFLGWRSTIISLYKWVRESFLLKALNVYWKLSRSILGERSRSFGFEQTSLIFGVFFSFNSKFLQFIVHFLFFAAKYFKNVVKIWFYFIKFYKTTFSKPHNSPHPPLVCEVSSLTSDVRA